MPSDRSTDSDEPPTADHEEEGHAAQSTATLDHLAEVVTGESPWATSL